VGRTDSLITQSSGGKLVSQDSRVTVIVQPDTVTKDVVIRYQPTAEKLLPTGLSIETTKIIYAFSLVTLNESGAQLPYFPLESEKEATIIVRLTDDDLRVISSKGNHICIGYWDEIRMDWKIVCLEIIKPAITIDTDKLGQFVLAVSE
jgi:hypothetical protein